MLPSLARLALQQADTGPIFTNHGLEQLEEKAREAGVRFQESQKLETECAICKYDFEPAEDGRKREDDELIVLKNCAHIYHVHCLKDSVERRQSNALLCPICKTEIHPDDLAALGHTNPAEGVIFVEAARDGNLARVKELIAAGVDVDFMHDGYTALVWASLNGSVDIVNVLLARPGIEVDKVNEGGVTALMKASLRGRAAVVKQLLAAGANVNLADNVGNTALITASAFGYPAIVKQLLAEPGVMVDEPRHGGDTALTVARYYGYTAIVAMLEAALEFLIAAVDGNLERVRALLDDGANVNMKNDANGRTALYMASSQGHADVVAALLNAPGINVNQTDKHGQTALIAASMQGNPAIVKMLLDVPGIKVKVSDLGGNTALTWARRYDRPAIVAMLEAANEFFEAANDGNLARVRALLWVCGANVNMVDKFGNTALMKASLNGRDKVVKMLLDGGADVNVMNNNRRTALMLASREGHADIVALLREAGATE